MEMNRLITNDEYVTKKGRIHRSNGGKWRISVKSDANIAKKNPPPIPHGEPDPKRATYEKPQNVQKIQGLKIELDRVRCQFKKFRKISADEIKTLRKDKSHYSTQYENYKEKISNIEKYADSLRQDNYIVYFSLMKLIDSQEIKSK